MTTQENMTFLDDLKARSTLIFDESIGRSTFLSYKTDTTDHHFTLTDGFCG